MNDTIYNPIYFGLYKPIYLLPPIFNMKHILYILTFFAGPIVFLFSQCITKCSSNTTSNNNMSSFIIDNTGTINSNNQTSNNQNNQNNNGNSNNNGNNNNGNNNNGNNNNGNMGNLAFFDLRNIINNLFVIIRLIQFH
jgi:hypothetical protein